LKISILKDIETRDDIKLLVDTFYRDLIKDKHVGPFFTDVVKINWEEHFPKMYDFWETMLLGKMVYKGNPMLTHIELSRKMPLEAPHFERWLSLWQSTLQNLYTGPVSDMAFQKASQIAGLMMYKVGKHS
jgi:hemoglobin